MKLRGSGLCAAAAVAVALAAAGFCFAGATARAGLAGYDAAARTVSGGATLLVEAVTRRPMREERREFIALGRGSRGGAEARRGSREAARSAAAGSRAFRTTRYPALGVPGDRVPAVVAAPFGILPPRLSASAGASSSARGRMPGYDAAGQRAQQRVFTSDYYYRESLYAWDAFGRLVRCQFNSHDPYAWTATYDGLGRRLISTLGNQPPEEGASEQSVYDPAVEFLELEVRQGDAVARKLYGPDGSGGLRRRREPCGP